MFRLFRRVPVSPWTIAAAVTLGGPGAGVAFAQVSPPLVATVRASSAAITGSCIATAVVRVTVQNGGDAVRLSDAACPSGTFSADASSIRLTTTHTVAAVQVLNGVTSAAATAAVQPADAPGDERQDFEASAYIGLAIDTFGADDLKRYLNPEANGDKMERNIFGFDFEYGLYRRPGRPQVWVYGETLHGVRSEDIKCTEGEEVLSYLPSCRDSIAGFAGNIPENALFMLRNASTIEAYIGVRVEMKQLNIAGRHPATLYLNVQPGFLEVTGSDGDAKAMHHIGFGARSIGGALAGSHLEVGFGSNELVQTNRHRRFKIDGYMQRRLTRGFSLFAQMFVDVDGKDGADSIQSYFGLTFDVASIVGTLGD